jgi:hypothetical protein
VASTISRYEHALEPPIKPSGRPLLTYSQFARVWVVAEPMSGLT